MSTVRIAVIADTHLTSPDVESNSLFPRQIVAMKEAGPALYEKMRAEIERAYAAVMDDILRQGSWDAIVHLGDATGGYCERGSNHPTITALLDRLSKDMRGVAKKPLFIPENHDLGWEGTGTGRGGITATSIEICSTRFGSPWWSHGCGDLILLGVCSSLLRYEGKDECILSYKYMQEDFILEFLANKHSRPWILCIHNPFSVRDLIFKIPEIESYESSLVAMLYGDYHNPLWNFPVKVMSAVKSGPKSMVPKGVLCPSTAPLWWRGYGYLVLEIEGERFSCKKRSAKRPPDSVDIPTSSALRCMLWMLKSSI